MEMGEKIEDLREAAELDGTEIGEFWASLCSVASKLHYGASDEFHRAVVKEIDGQHEYLKSDFEIVETEEIFTRKIRSLEFLG